MSDVSNDEFEQFEAELLSTGVVIDGDEEPRVTTVTLTGPEESHAFFSADGWKVEVVPEFVMCSRFDDDGEDYGDGDGSPPAEVVIYPWHRIVEFRAVVEGA